MARKATFGTMATCKVRYVIAVIFTDNTHKFVTKMQNYPHHVCEWNNGEQAIFFDDKKCAEDTCFGLNLNDTGAFVIEVPDYFNESMFKNKE